MKDIDGIIIFLFGTIVVVCLFFFVTFNIKRAFQAPQKPKDDKLIQLERIHDRRIQDSEQKMDDLRRRIDQQQRDHEIKQHDNEMKQRELKDRMRMQKMRTNDFQRNRF